ncbi:MAG TPA: TauD/TfdA family dioxygenase, partial [Allocoleopsis sp.]
MQITVQPLSEHAGQQIINRDRTNLLDLDREEIISLFKSYGFLLFRGFGNSIETFTEFTNSLSKDFMDYTGGVFNRRIINNNATILSVNDFKNEIKLHGEMYYQQSIPLMLWFFCAQPALQGGETILCDGRQLFNELSNSHKELFSKKKLKFVGHLNKEGWQKRYKTDDLKEVKQVFKSNNIHFKVNEDKSIDLQYICPAIHPTLCGKYQVFINSLLSAKHMVPDAVCFEDDSEVANDIVSEINEIAERLTIEISWRQGDI